MSEASEWVSNDMVLEKNESHKVEVDTNEITVICDSKHDNQWYNE